ncbi:MAG: hypothetical protein KF901_15800 [Myxococcales bacterium]|nr:hypothetical protein [Myxococcales bacterium]
MSPSSDLGHPRALMGINALKLLGVLEAADRVEQLDDWAAAFGTSLRRTTRALGAQLLRVREGGARLELLGPEDPIARAVVVAGHGTLDGDQRRRLYASGVTVACVGDLFGAGPLPEPLGSSMAAAGVGDVLGLVAPPGLSVGVFFPERLRLDLRRRQLLASFCQHLGASVALREAREERALDAADLPAELDGALEELDQRRRWARRHGDADDAASAVAFLGALANEGFAVVEEARRGRRRRLVAVRVREPSARAMRALDEGERAVLEGLIAGCSSQEIAFDLGVAEATVSGRIARIRSKLGLDPRDEIVRVAAARRRS